MEDLTHPSADIAEAISSALFGDEDYEVHLPRAMWDRITKHLLEPTIDVHITISDNFDPQELANRVRDELRDAERRKGARL